MQDIGGCGAAVPGIAKVCELVERHDDTAAKDKLIRRNDYTRTPQKSGYRGHHLAYRHYSDGKQTYDDLKVGFELRSMRQHVWAPR